MDNTDQLWQAACGDLELELSRANYATWIYPCRLTHASSDTGVIATPSVFVQRQLETRYTDMILGAINKHGGNLTRLEFSVGERIKPTAPKEPIKTDIKPTIEAAGPPTTTPTPAPMPRGNQFNPSHTFASFVVSNNNRLAYAASEAVARNPGTVYNPLFLYGGVGLGKTHLMHAVANEILAGNPGKQILYVSCERFTNEFVTAIHTGKMREFKEKYRTVDVLLVDDIQFLSNKEGTQEEFFHTFNALHQSNRQIIVTADRIPKQIPELEERLSSRFGWGMIADIQSPNFETRIAILRSKCVERHASVPNDALEYIASQVQHNIRELEGALTRVLTYFDLYRVPPSLTATKEALSGLITPVNRRTVSPDILFKIVGEHFGLPLDGLLSAKRTKLLVYPRQIIMYILYKELHYSYPQIGRELGGKDHTTIMYGCAKIEKELSSNTQVARDISRIKERLQEL